MRTLNKTFATTAGTQNVRTEKIASQEWVNVPLDQVLVISKLGVYGATTVLFELWNGLESIIPPSKTNAATYDGDFNKMQALNYVLRPGSALRFYSTDTAASPAGETISVIGTYFNLEEL